MHRNEAGLTFSAASEAAVAAFDRTIGAYLHFSRDTGACLKETLKIDPGMMMAHVLKGCFFQLMGLPSLLPKAREALAAADKLAGGASAREHLHLAALRAWSDGNFPAAVAAWEAVLLEWPRDILALKLANYLHFYLGDTPNVRDSVARTRHAWNRAIPGYSFVQGLHAFGLEENGELEAAEREGRAAVEADCGDPWAVHAVAHVMEARDRWQEGIAWLDGLAAHWDACNNFRYHLWWHRALMHLGLGEYDQALELYDRRLWDPTSDEYLDMCNDASLLLRLELAGIDVGTRWEALAEKVKGKTDTHILSFVDAHYMMALAGANQRDEALRMLDSLRSFAAGGTSTTARVTAEVGCQLCEAICAYRARDFGRTVDLLQPIRYRFGAVGGSHAQRDIFAQVLVDAAIRADRLALARALLAERIARRPGSHWNWRRYASVLQQLGDLDGAHQAAARAGSALAA